MLSTHQRRHDCAPKTQRGTGSAKGEGLRAGGGAGGRGLTAYVLLQRATWHTRLTAHDQDQAQAGHLCCAVGSRCPWAWAWHTRLNLAHAAGGTRPSSSWQPVFGGPAALPCGHVLQVGRRLGQTLVGNTWHPHLRLRLLLRVLLSYVSGFGASTLRACWVTGMYSGGPSSCPSVSQACPFHSNGLLFSIYAGCPRIPMTSSQS